jgi:hypothetical protein
MSKSQNPMTGQMSGSMANFVTTRRGKQNIIRSKAFEPRDANSEAQQMQRSGFKLVVDVYPMLGSIPEEGFAQRDGDTTVYIAFMKANMPGAIDKSGDEVTLDFSKLIVSNGTLSRPVVTEATLDATGISLSYLPMLKNKLNLPSDEVVALALLKSGELWVERQPRGEAETDTLLIPVTNISVTDLEGVYLFVKRADGSKVSASIYVAING